MRSWHTPILLLHTPILLLLTQVGGEVRHANKTTLVDGAIVTSTESPSSPPLTQADTTPAPCTSWEWMINKEESLLRNTIELLQVENINNLNKEIRDLEKQRDQKEEQKQDLQQRNNEQTDFIERLRRENLEEITKIKKEYEDKLQQTLQDNEENLTRITKENEDNLQMIIQRNTRKEIVLKKKLSGKTTLISYMMSVLQQSEEMRKSRQDANEAKANKVSEKLEKYEECQHQNNANLKIVFKSQEIIRKQAENIVRLQDIVNMDQNLTRTYDKIEKNDPTKNNCDLTAWMKSLTEAYTDQQKKIEELTALVGQNEKIEEHMNSMKTDILKLSNDETDILRLRIEENSTIEKYQQLIMKQSEGIEILRKLMSYTVNSTSALRYEEAEDGTLLSASPCACIPDPPNNSGLTPAKITYACTGSQNKTYNLDCDKETCANEEWPKCDEEIAMDVSKDESLGHDEVTWKFVNCHKVFIRYLNQRIYCGPRGGTNTTNRIGLFKNRVGQGVFNQEVSLPCIECEEEEFEWSPWSWSAIQRKSTRKRGLREVANSYQEEEKPGCKEGWTQYENACYKIFTGESSRNSYGSICQKNGGNLTSVSSSGENDFLKNLLRDYPKTQLTWIGGYGCTCGNCKWIDGSDWVWSNWGPSQPGGSDCVFIGYKANNGLWYDGTCQSSSRVDGICKIA